MVTFLFFAATFGGFLMFLLKGHRKNFPRY